MDDRRQRMGAYRRARRKFACIAYLVTLAWLVLALAQWMVISLISDATEVFMEYYWISVVFFAVAMVMVSVFIFFEKVRFIIGLNWVLAVLIVEFAIIGLFALAARSLWPDLLMWFFICVLLLFLSVLIGSIIPHDLTLDVVTLFVLAFIFLVATIFFTMMHIMIALPYSFVVFQIFISVVVLLFVMYHAQTINGGRFAEMRLNDYLLASLILFHDFIIIFLLTFYAQIVYRVASRFSSTTTSTTGAPFTWSPVPVENNSSEIADNKPGTEKGGPSQGESFFF